MNDTALVSIETIFQYLDKAEPLEAGPEDTLAVFSRGGNPVYLHADVNRDDKYGYLCEWWLSSDTEDYIAGGFEPAGNDAEVMQLAGLIHATCTAEVQGKS